MVVEEADYVIVGAGSAGCVLANRLSAAASARVVVLEAGGDDRPLRNLRQLRSNLNIHVPAGFTRMLADPNVSWNYMSDAEPAAGGRSFLLPRGKVLGGSSSINGMLWVQGLPIDYDTWRQLGCVGWSWSDVEPLFRRLERHADASDNADDALADVSAFRQPHVMLDRMISAFQQAGAPATDDINGARREGAARVRVNMLRGRRRSAAVSYLHPVMRRANLRVLTNALASKVVFEGKRAVGVEFFQDGVTKIIRAKREVILSGGAINSPQLLELSGVGDGERLRRLGVEVLAHSPRVGENLQDHFACLVRARLKPGTPSFNAISHGFGLLSQMAIYGLTGTGLLSVPGAALTAFVKSEPDLEVPDLQLFGSPATIDYEAAKKGRLVMDTEPGLTLGGHVMRPNSRGSIHAASPDVRQAPTIRLNYLQDADDQQRTIKALKWSRRVIAQPALSPFIDHELTPGAAAASDDELLDFARAYGSTSYHQAGTCAMGAAADSVLDPQLRVNGVSGLRVVDASAMPVIASGNTHAPTVMIAEKAAELIRQAV